MIQPQPPLSPRAKKRMLIICCSVVGAAVVFVLITVLLASNACNSKMFIKTNKHVNFTAAKIVEVNYGIGRSSTVSCTGIAYINDEKVVFLTSFSRSDQPDLYLNEFYAIEYLDDFTCCSRLPRQDTCYNKQAVLKALNRQESDYLYNPSETLEKTGNMQFYIIKKWLKWRFPEIF